MTPGAQPEMLYVLNQKTSLSLSDEGTSAEAEIFVAPDVDAAQLGQLSNYQQCGWCGPRFQKY